MRAAAKHIGLRLLRLRGVSELFAPVMRNRCTIFMLHRFRAPQLGVEEGQDPEVLRRGLELLRRRRFKLVSLEDLFRRITNDEPLPSRAVAFTLDDGYAEQAHVAGPIFRDYDCPATTFVTTGFVDGALWFWWDRIRYVFQRTRERRVQLTLEGYGRPFVWQRGPSATDAEAAFVEYCKSVPETTKELAIANLAKTAEVTVPHGAPTGYQAMTWEDLRKAERLGMTFAPHTVTHPILANTSDEASRHELQESWRRVAAEAASAVKVFCYPNGRWTDFGPREVDTLKALGFLGAVVGVAGFAGRDAKVGWSRFAVKRFPYPDDVDHLVQYVSGLERLKMILRGMQP